MKKLGSILLALLILLPCLPVVRAEGMTIEVGTGETYETISALLSDSNAGLSGDVTIQLTRTSPTRSPSTTCRPV